MFTVGIDEAGRGCLLGPIVVGMVAVSPEQAAELQALGVRDSKDFGSGAKAHDKRKALAESILTIAECAQVVGMPAEQMDRFMVAGINGVKLNLNQIEQCLASSLLSKLPQHWYNDPRAAEKYPDTFKMPPTWEVICDGAQVFGDLTHGNVKITAVNNGEAAHVAVAAASIIAKYSRDQMFLEMRKKYVEFEPIGGNGYGNPGTYSFLSKYKAKYGQLPEEARRAFIKT